MLGWLHRGNVDDNGGGDTYFGRRILAVRPNGDRRLVVRAAQRTNDGECIVVEETFDAVVFCIPAPDALSVEGVTDLLDDEDVRIFKHVRYDSWTFRGVST